MKPLSICLVALAFVAGCGGGGAVPVTNTLVGGTWHWTAYETPTGTRTGCTVQPNQCGTTWTFTGNSSGGTRTDVNGSTVTWTLAGSTLSIPTEDTTIRWIGTNEFAERRAGLSNWEIWTRN